MFRFLFCCPNLCVHVPVVCSTGTSSVFEDSPDSMKMSMLITRLLCVLVDVNPDRKNAIADQFRSALRPNKNQSRSAFLLHANNTRIFSHFFFFFFFISQKQALNSSWRLFFHCAVTVLSPHTVSDPLKKGDKFNNWFGICSNCTIEFIIQAVSLLHSDIAFAASGIRSQSE